MTTIATVIRLGLIGSFPELLQIGLDSHKTTFLDDRSRVFKVQMRFLCSSISIKTLKYTELTCNNTLHSLTVKNVVNLLEINDLKVVITIYYIFIFF